MELRRESPDYRVKLQVCLVFLFLLMGSMTFERLGSSNWFGVPERLQLAVVVLAASYLLQPSPRAKGRSRVGRTWPPVYGIHLYCLVSLFWSPLGDKTVDAVVDVVCILVMIHGFVRIFRDYPLNTIDILAVCFSWVGAVYAVVGLASADIGSRLSVFGGGPNVYGRITALGLLATVHLLSSGRAKAYIAFLPFQLLATVLSGSRGALIALIIACVVYLPSVRGKHILTTFFAMGAMLAAPLAHVFEHPLAMRVTEILTGRIWQLTVEQGYTSGRTALYQSALEMFKDNPLFGGGLQSWGPVRGTFLGHDYPHNVVLQFAAELGGIGLVALLVTCTLACSAALRPRGTGTSERRPPTFVVAGLILTFVGLQFSGGYYDTRMLWVFMIACSFPRARDTVLERHLTRFGGDRGFESPHSPAAASRNSSVVLP